MSIAERPPQSVLLTGPTRAQKNWRFCAAELSAHAFAMPLFSLLRSSTLSRRGLNMIGSPFEFGGIESSSNADRAASQRFDPAKYVEGLPTEGQVAIADHVVDRKTVRAR